MAPFEIFFQYQEEKGHKGPSQAIETVITIEKMHYCDASPSSLMSCS